MRTKQFTLLCMALFLSLVFLACNTQLGSPNGMPKVVGAQAVNEKEILVEFAEPAGAMANSASSYVIRGPDSVRLAVHDVAMAADRTSAMLSTDDQQPDTAYVLEFGGGAFPVGTFERARVVGAVATNNTTVIVTFSEPMGLSARSEENYVIVQESLNAEAGVLIVESAAWAHPIHDAVRLTTLPQNEVNYVLRVANVRDASDRPMAPPELLVDPSVATFRGMPASCSDVCSNGADGRDGEGACDEDDDCVGVGSCVNPGDDGCLNTCVCSLTDTDDDGLPDHVEQRGWVVTIELTTREGVFDRRDTQTRDVTSDPRKSDTDGDGLSDKTERELASDPREPDSDGDGLDDSSEFNVYFSNPTDQDTDEDQIDDFLEVSLYRTSPTLDDTDGDGFDDFEELIEFNRNPRIADLPRPGFRVGNMRIEISELYSTTDEQGETVTMESNSSTTMTQSEDTTFFGSETDVTGNARDIFLKGGVDLEFDGSFIPKVGIHAEGGVTWKKHSEHTTQFGSDSTQAAQEVFAESLAKGRELSTTTSVTREVVGARVDVDLTVENQGSIAFAITNIELTMVQPSGLNLTDFVPIATLVSNSGLVTGEIPTFNLGPFTEELGPFVFRDRDIFASEVDSLLRDPRGLIFKVANYDILDEFGRNFAFASQAARDRTTGITIDYGDGTVDRFLVATAGARDVGGYAGGGNVGGFDPDTGAPLGLPLDFILQDTLGLTKNGTTPDAIVPGPDGVVDSLAEGDDIQLIPLGTAGVADDAVAITAGDNGVLDTALTNDDESIVSTGYATSATCSLDTDSVFDPENPDILLDGPGFACVDDADCPGVGTCTGSKVLSRVRNRRLGDFNRIWAVFSTGQIPAAADFGTIVLSAGDDITMAFVQDLDRDGLFAQEEYLYGSSDTKDDTDDDGIFDFAEIRVGWDVGVVGEQIRAVLSDPRVPDSDGDKLSDFEEQDLAVLFCRCTAGSGPLAEQPCSDDGDCGTGSCECFANACLCEDGPEIGLPCSSPSACEGFVCQGGPGGGPCSGPLFADIFPGVDILTETLRLDPRSPDTDSDGVPDIDELASYNVGLSIRDPEPGGSDIADSQALSDDIQKVFVGQPVGPSQVVVLPGPNGVIDSVLGGDDVLDPGTLAVTGPLNPDHDGDTRPDGHERDAGSDPTDANDSDDFIDSDRDGMSDAAEESEGWDVTTTDIFQNVSVVHRFSSKFVADTDFDGLPDLLERSLRTDPTRADTDGDGLDDFDEFADFAGVAGLSELFPGFVIDGTDSLRVGTDPTKQDTDGDALFDLWEATGSYTVLVNGETRVVSSNPLVFDTDLDGLDDFWELAGEDFEFPPVDANNDGVLDGSSTDALDPTDPDTDGDGAFDGQEFGPGGSDPLVPDLVATVSITSIFFDQPDPGSRDWAFRIRTQLVDENLTTMLDAEDFSGCAGFPFDSGCGNFGGSVELPSDNYGASNPTGVCGTNQTFSMQAGDILLIRVDTNNHQCPGGGSFCFSSSVHEFFFDGILSTSWQEFVVDSSIEGSPGFDACEVEVVFEIFRE